MAFEADVSTQKPQTMMARSCGFEFRETCGLARFRPTCVLFGFGFLKPWGFHGLSVNFGFLKRVVSRFLWRGSSPKFTKRGAAEEARP